MGKGYLMISAKMAEESLPVSGAVVYILKDNIVLYETITDEFGNTDYFEIEAPDKNHSLDFTNSNNVYGLVDVMVQKEGYVPVHVHDVEILDTISSVLPVEMIYDDGTEINEIDIYIEDSALKHRTSQAGVNVQLFQTVFIPDYIRVHLGTPANSSARMVTVKFTDYIKNVTSSEIYATWPQNSIISNIHVIVTFAINRIYTQWYPSRGFNFDITNSTAYDQAYIHGRNIYQNISTLVDEYFNVYARRYGFRNPFFTQFCSGTTATCNGLSQTGTVPLANQGLNPLQILRRFYPNDIELIRTNNIQSVVSSYPGYALRNGMSGEHVLFMQNYLNRIRVNFPLIPQIQNPDGVFGAVTESAVRAFQRAFNMTSDGIIGRGTWYKIISIYVGVIKLAELDSEGERVGLSPNPPTVVIREGNRGAYVAELQFIINYIAPYYASIPPVVKDSSFGAATKTAVVEFQKLFNLTPDGVVGPATWNKLYAVFRGIKEEDKVPAQPDVDVSNAPKFPGVALRVGSSGANVRLMQSYLNTIRAFYPSIPLLVVDGQFGNNTRNAVIAFQREFLLSPDGIIGPITWAKIVEQFLLVTGQNSISTNFPGTNLTVGSRGQNVRLMQTFLNDLGTVYPSIPSLVVDGIFGNNTRNAVIAFQRLFNLTPDGIIGPITWGMIVQRRNENFG